MHLSGSRCKAALRLNCCHLRRTCNRASSNRIFCPSLDISTYLQLTCNLTVSSFFLLAAAASDGSAAGPAASGVRRAPLLLLTSGSSIGSFTYCLYINLRRFDMFVIGGEGRVVVWCYPTVREYARRVGGRAGVRLRSRSLVVSCCQGVSTIRPKLNIIHPSLKPLCACVRVCVCATTYAANLLACSTESRSSSAPAAANSPSRSAIE